MKKKKKKNDIEHLETESKDFFMFLFVKLSVTDCKILFEKFTQAFYFRNSRGTEHNKTTSIFTVLVLAYEINRNWKCLPQPRKML